MLVVPFLKLIVQKIYRMHSVKPTYSVARYMLDTLSFGTKESLMMRGLFCVSPKLKLTQLRLP